MTQWLSWTQPTPRPPTAMACRSAVPVPFSWLKLIESAQDRCRAVNAPHLAAPVRAGATFINGEFAGGPGGETQP
jgi:hypothetical protein